MQKLYCFSYPKFNEYMITRGWTSENFPSDSAMISICNSNGSQYGMYHYFNDSPHVMNMNFDDVDPNTLEEGKWLLDDGTKARLLGYDDAKRLVEFIDKCIDCDFYIHCAAGTSRSQGVVRYILDMYPDHQWETLADNPPLYPNYHVVTVLKRCFREKYENENCL